MNSLVREGMMVDEGKVDSTGGRKASAFGLNPGAAYFLGVEIRKGYMNISLMDFAKSIQHQQAHIPFQLKNTAASFAAFIRGIKQFLSQHTIPLNRIKHCGVAVSGRINQRTGQSFNTFNFLEGSLAQSIEQEISIPTTLENNARAMAWAEVHAGENQGEKNTLLLNLDHGI